MLELPFKRGGPAQGLWLLWQLPFCILINEATPRPDFGAIGLYNVFIMSYALCSFSAPPDAQMARCPDTQIPSFADSQISSFYLGLLMGHNFYFITQKRDRRTTATAYRSLCLCGGKTFANMLQLIT